MNELRKRSLALAVYQLWFNAPAATGAFSAQRLIALGFSWTGRRWKRPIGEEFVHRMMEGPL